MSTASRSSSLLCLLAMLVFVAACGSGGLEDGIFTGLVKSVFFGLGIGLISCYKGFNCGTGASGSPPTKLSA